MVLILPGEAFLSLVEQEWCWAGALPPVAWVGGGDKWVGKEGGHRRQRVRADTTADTTNTSRIQTADQPLNSTSRPWICAVRILFLQRMTFPPAYFKIWQICIIYTPFVTSSVFLKLPFFPSAFLLCDPEAALCHPLSAVIAQLPISENT